MSALRGFLLQTPDYIPRSPLFQFQIGSFLRKPWLQTNGGHTHFPLHIYLLGPWHGNMLLGAAVVRDTHLTIFHATHWR